MHYRRFCSKLTTSAKRAIGPALWMQWTKATWSLDGGSFWVSRCSATTAVASPRLPVSLACFGSGLFNELGKHMTNWRQREGEGEGGRKEGESVCVWRQSHGQSHLRGGVNTKCSSTIHPSAAAADAVQRRGAEQGDDAAAVTSDRWQCSHASKERAHPHLLLLVVVVVVVVAHGPQQPAVQHKEV